MLGRRQAVFSTAYFQFEKRFDFLFVYVMNTRDDLLCLPSLHLGKWHKLSWNFIIRFLWEGLTFGVLSTELQDKVDELMSMFNKIQTETEEREKVLTAALVVSEKFWDDLSSVMLTLKDLHDNLDLQDPPALDPSSIREQQDMLEVRYQHWLSSLKAMFLYSAVSSS